MNKSMKLFNSHQEMDADQKRNYASVANQQTLRGETLQSWLIIRLAEQLSIEPAEIDIHESFSNYGLGSAEAVELSGELETWLQRELSPTLLFDYPNIAVLVRHLMQEEKNVDSVTHDKKRLSETTPGEPIAIIGIGCRFPGNASTPERFWELLQNGVDAVTEVPSTRWNIDAFYDSNPDTSGKMYTRSGSFLPDIDQFDAHFFGISPREAARMHPQQRLLLEVAWEALENAGQKLEGLAGSQTAVFVGMMATHDYALLQAQSGDKTYIDDPYFGIGNAASITSGRLSYLFDLQGPNLAVDTACSSSLVAVHLACESLRRGECSMALVGGVSTNIHPEQMINACKMHMLSPDGRCKTFDATADGFAMGEGCGVVILKRLSDALNAQDPILALIRGSAVNQDGRSNGITAPNKLAQEAVIRQALAQAQVDPLAVSYVEAHGSATPLGDPIEIEALAATFGQARALSHPLMVGSVKTNIGHLGGAAGIAGLIKTVLALQKREIPPHLHLNKRNTHIRWNGCPVVIPTSRMPWPTDDEKPRMAGVSSFGWSGTNAHLILEEGPRIPVEEPDTKKSYLISLSAKTEAALEHVTDDLLLYLKQHPQVLLADVAYTYHIGRTAFAHRRTLVCANSQEAISALEKRDATKVITAFYKEGSHSVAFLFPDAGDHYVGMAQQLYQQEFVFRAWVDTCAELLQPHLGLDLREYIYSHSHVGKALHQLAQPIVFVIEYALAQLLLSWEIVPTALLGYNLGEYVAACLSGVFSLHDALKMVVQRTQDTWQPSDEAALSLAHEEILVTVHTFHPAVTRPRVEEFMGLMRTIDLHPPQIPYISNVTGTWITAEQAIDPAYWSRHLYQIDRFVNGIGELRKNQQCILIEVGPGPTLSQADFNSFHPGTIVIPTLPHAYDSQQDRAFLLGSMGKLWQAGVKIGSMKWYAEEKRRLLPLPNYPFAHQRYWVETQVEDRVAQRITDGERSEHDRTQWLYVPIWKQAQPSLIPLPHNTTQCMLLFLDEYGFGRRLAEQFRAQGYTVLSVIASQSFQRVTDEVYTIHPQAGEDYDALLKHLNTIGKTPQHILHLWSLTEEFDTSNQEQLASLHNRVFYSLLFLAQAIGNHQYHSPLHLTVISNQLHNVLGEEVICPEKALLLGPCKVIPKEYPALSCCSIDITLPEAGSLQEEALLTRLARDIFIQTDKDVIAYRGTQRWEQAFENVQQPDLTDDKTLLREKGVYLITGGLGGIALAIAEHLARTVHARLVLISRTGLPPREQWSNIIAARGTTETTGRKLQALQHIEELGGEVLPLQADVTNEDQMRGVIQQTLATFGVLHGVLHAAGVPGMGLLQLKTSSAGSQCTGP